MRTPWVERASDSAIMRSPDCSTLPLSRTTPLATSTSMSSSPSDGRSASRCCTESRITRHLFDPLREGRRDDLELVLDDLRAGDLHRLGASRELAVFGADAAEQRDDAVARVDVHRERRDARLEDQAHLHLRGDPAVGDCASE
jgi:hypothetical protein